MQSRFCILLRGRLALLLVVLGTTLLFTSGFARMDAFKIIVGRFLLAIIFRCTNFKQQQNNLFNYTSGLLQLWDLNELYTVFLFSIV